MPGTAAGIGSVVDPMVDAISHEQWYETDRASVGDVELGLVHHGDKDPGGHAVWEGDRGTAVVYGAVSNRSSLGYDPGELVDALVDRPSIVLPKLDGPFLLAWTDGETLSVATDKLATRPAYYAETDAGPVVSSELKAVLEHVDDVELDVGAATDVLSFGFVLGEKTLARQASALPPSSLLTADEEGVEVRRYWSPEFGRASPEGYVERALDTYRTAVGNTANTLSGRVGVWLSGGLDSRPLAAVLKEEHGNFRTLTYDTNPPDGSNLGPAREVADLLGVENRVVGSDGTTGFGDYTERAVELTDGMNSWAYFVEPGYVFGGLHDDVDVTLEGAPQGELFGEDIWYSHMAAGPDAETVISRSYSRVAHDTVRDLLTATVDPDASVREEVAKSDRSQLPHRVMDTWFRNFTSNSHFRGNKLYRSQVGTRVPFANGEFLDTVAKMPHERFRRTTFPYTRGKIPRSMSPLKRELVNEMDDGLESIPYERTRLSPKWPLAAHDVTYVAKQAYWRLVSPRPTPLADALREDTPVRDAVDGWLDTACERDIFDEGTIRELQAAHRAGEANNLRPLANVTTVELWLRRHVDGERTTAEADAPAQKQ